MIAEVVQLSDEAAGGTRLPGAFEEVVLAEVAGGQVVREHVPGGDEDGML